MDVGGWLRGLGLGQYEEKFRDNKIDADLLPRLTVDDLKDIGVSVVGDRRRLLDAIAVIAGAGRPADLPASPKKSAPSKGLQALAERRPITVLFCDLVGSTSLAAKLDAEDWRNLVNAYLDEASAAVTGLGGHVLKKLGDGLMALFGYPQAQENDAERAVRAALAIQRALSELNARNARSGAPQLSARIGLESGPVVVEASGEVFGDAPNVAARVQAAAEPGSVLITLNVQRQIAGLFVVEEQGARELRGVTEPVELFRIVRASGGGRRGGARTLTPFVGREEELGVLARRWERARAGEGQLVLIVGEPGLGKSRLIEEFHSQLTETPHTWSEWSASQLLQNTPLHPIAEWGRQRFGVDAAAEQRLADLENTLRLIGLDPAEHAPLLAPLVDIPLRPERAASFPPEELRRRQLAAMTAWILAAARTQAVVLAFEDLHWADPTSLDLLRALADRGAQAPLLLLATTRPEFRPPWSLRSHHSLISLSPLDRAGVARMVGEISASHALSKEVIEGVSERTGGVPLFVEEVTRLLVERGEQGGVQAIPPTLQQSLAARLDRLGPAREVAQVGAVLGRDFVYALLRDVAEIDEPALQASLERLADADLLFVEGAPPEAKYRFKHALIQDAAYDSLLKSRRQALHRRAAEALREANAEPEAIAHHFTEAGLDDLAIEWWGKAGDQALRRSAFQEAIAHLGKAIELADRDGRAVARQPTVSAAVPNLTQLHAAQGVALFAARGGGALETTEAFARARESASRDEDAPERLAADYGLWVGSYVRGELPSMRAGVRAFLGDTEARPDSPEAGVAHRAAGLTCWFAGEYREARDHLERALGLFLPGRDDDLAFRFGLDPGVAAMVNLAAVSWSLGEVDNAISLIERMQTRLAGLTHVGMLAFGKMHSALFDLMRGDHARATPKTFQLASIAREHELAMYDAFGAFLHGWTTTKSGTLAAGLENMRRGVAMLREQNILLFDGLLKIALAEAEAAAGDLDRALAALGEGLATAELMGFRAFEAELHRARGDILLQRDPGNPAPVEEAFLTAIAVAKQQGTRSFELRAALSLAKVYRATDRLAAADAVLAPAIEGFAPTPQMPEIAAAQALLAALSQSDEVKSEAARRQRRTRLHVAYGNALIAARGFGAPETTAAFARARESASGVKDAPERLAADWGLWSSSYVRGELPSMRAHAATLLSGVEARPDSPEAGVAHRAAGLRCWFTGEYREARDHFERALALFQPGRDDDLAFRFGQDSGVGAMAYLALASWPLGEVDRAISLIDRMQMRIADLTHVGTRAFGRLHGAFFELMRGEHARAAPNAFELARLGREHDLPMWRAFGVFLEGLATAATGAPGGGLDDMRRGVELLREQNVLLFDGLLKIALAEAEAGAGDPERAIAILDEALATCDRTGYRAFEAELHRVRGKILLTREPANPAPAEEALRTAIAVAKQQGTRSFELRAALSLAKMYQSISRPADAHVVLALTLDGFRPTPEMPEIAEAQALLAALEEMDEVKSEVARRRRKTRLHAAYGNAMILAHGYGARETSAAFERARDTATAEDGFERLSAQYGLWAGSFVRAELGAMRELSAAMLRDCERWPQSGEASIAHRMRGVTHWFAGEFVAARGHLEKAIAIFDPERDGDLAVRFGQDPGLVATAYLAQVLWLLGEVALADQRMTETTARAAKSGHAATSAYGFFMAAQFELIRRNPDRAATFARSLIKIANEHQLPFWMAYSAWFDGWLEWRSGDRKRGLAAMRKNSLARQAERSIVFETLLAEAEAEAGESDVAFCTINHALAASERTGRHWYDVETHRIRGEILLRGNSADTLTAEEAFQRAIAVAGEQGARSFGLRAALSLARLYQSTGRPAEAHALLEPALQGFSSTLEMPEIAEAQALLVAIEAAAHLTHE
jgi:class 3 adenylate cyclase/predicted ATPase